MKVTKCEIVELGNGKFFIRERKVDITKAELKQGWVPCMPEVMRALTLERFKTKKFLQAVQTDLNMTVKRMFDNIQGFIDRNEGKT